MIRLLPLETALGPAQMAADETMLRTAAESGLASLRFYTWSVPTLSLGYFQPHQVQRTEPPLASLPMVRRASGGAALVHHRELTYALALPPGNPWHTNESWIPRMHRIIAEMLESLDLKEPILALKGETRILGPTLCFLKQTPDDLLCQGKKIVGSAQRKHHQALLQHGSILLEQSPYTPQLPGLWELADFRITPEKLALLFEKKFAGDTGWKLQQGNWLPNEMEKKIQIEKEKYSQPSWNEKR